MKPVSIHPLSALAGAGLLGLVLLAVGAQSQIQVRPWRDLVRVAGIPDPRQMLVISEGTPFVVPAGKLLAITGLGSTRDPGSTTFEVTLRVDGVDEFAAAIRLPLSGATTICEPPPGFTVRAGSTVEVVSGSVFGSAWGYLVDVMPPPRLVHVAGIPDPRSMVVIRQGAPFTVPAGKLLVITGPGGAASDSEATLMVAGLSAFVAIGNPGYGGSCSICRAPSGLSLLGGSNVTVAAGFGTGRAWGYLVDA